MTPGITIYWQLQLQTSPLTAMLVCPVITTFYIDFLAIMT